MDEYRDITGANNNPLDEKKGQAGQEFIRKVSSDYGDGTSTLAGDDRPSARDVSNALMAQSAETSNAKDASNFLWMWGQFIDHDITLTREGEGESAPIAVPLGDSYFDPFSTGEVEMDFSRSGFAEGTGETTPREQVNIITPFIDA